MQHMNRIIFLDFDGVINSDCWFRKTVNSLRNPCRDLDPKAVRRVNRIIEATQAQTVVSSAWRQFYSLEELRGILHKVGFHGEVIAATPSSYDPQHLKRSWWESDRIRGDEIQAWLDHYKKPCKFVIFDDAEEMGHLDPYLVRTNFLYGLEEEHIPRALQILGVKSTSRKKKLVAA